MLNLSLVSAEHQIAAVGTELYAVACGLVESALPPAAVCVRVPFQSAAFYPAARKVEYADLLTGEGLKLSIAFGSDKVAVVG